MFKSFVVALAATFSSIPVSTYADQTDGAALEQLRSELVQLREEYETRIAALEQRLAKSEQPAPLPVQESRPVSGSSRFNPDIGIIFQGQAWQYGESPENYQIPGFPIGGEAGPVPEGLSLGETEIDISANVDDWFTAWLTLPVVIEDGEAAVEIEEAWIETTALPAGLSLRMGRFFSGIGYLNGQHSHAWDFVDQPLPYQAFLGSQYLDDGVQLRWVAPTDLYFELGAELLRGDRYPVSGAQDSGLGAYSLRARIGGDVGISHSWQAGLSWLSGESLERASGVEDEPLLFSGDSDLLMAELVWKWAPNGNWKQRNFKFQAEYLKRDERGSYTLPDGPELPWDASEEGWYLQAVYQPRPHWRFGVRYDALSGDDPGAAFDGSALAMGGSDPKRYSLMTDWSRSEFSRLRLQYTRDRAGLQSDDQWGLQYIYSIGAHGAHSF